MISRHMGVSVIAVSCTSYFKQEIIYYIIYHVNRSSVCGRHNDRLSQKKPLSDDNGLGMCGLCDG